MRSQVQPRPGKFPFRPELGAGLLSGSPGPSARDPRGRGGEHSAILKLFASSRPWKVLRPCTPRPRPTPLPRRALPGLRTPARSPGAPRLGRGPSLPVCKSFPGICLSLLVSDWAFCSGKGGGKFRWYFYWAGFPNRFFSPYPGKRGGVNFRFRTHSSFIPESFGSWAPFFGQPCGGKDVGSGEETVSERGLKQPPDGGVSCAIWSLSGKTNTGTGAKGGDPGCQDGPCWEAVRMGEERRWAGQLLKRGLQFKDESFIYSDDNYLDFCNTVMFDPRNRKNGDFKETCYCHSSEGSVEEPSGN